LPPGNPRPTRLANPKHSIFKQKFTKEKPSNPYPVGASSY
jgi:hypothetical protein